MIEAKKNNIFEEIDEIKSVEVFESDNKAVFKGSGENLSNYRIYGNTVDGESVGDRTGNLWGINGTVAFSNDVSVKSKDSEFIIQSSGINGTVSAKSPQYQNKFKLHLAAGTYTYSYRYNGTSGGIAMGVYTIEGEELNSNFMLLNDTDIYIGFYIPPNTTCNQRWMFMLNSGSEPLPYEPYGYKVPVTVEGKNLLQNTATSQTINGVTFTVNSDGSVTCNGTADASAPSALYIPFTLPIKLYELSGCPDSGSVSTYRVDIRNNDYSVHKYNGSNVIDNGTGCLFDGGNKQYCIRIAPGYTCNNLTFYPMIRKANIEDGTYEPYQTPITTPIYLPEQIRKVGDEAEYIDYGEQKQHRVRKNLLQNTATSQTINGVTFTVNEDGSVTCNTDENGATANTRFYLVGSTGTDFKKLNINANAIITGCPHGGKANTYALFILRKNDDMAPSYYNTLAETGNGLNLVYNETNKYVIFINISTGTICDNLTFYPMIRNADITDDTYEPYIENTELDVTLPALPTLSGTNTLSVNTNIKPSKVWGGLNDLRDILYVKDKLGNILFSKYYEIEDEPPLTFKAKKAGTLKNYRIYGQTVDGESVGDRTENLFYKKIENANIASNDGRIYSTESFDLWIGKVKAGETYTSYNINSIVGFFTDEPDYGVYTYDNSRITNATSVFTFTVPSGCSYVAIRFFKNEPTIMLNEGSTALPYEPYGYKVPVTVSNGTDTLTTPIYLPEQIKKVGDEAEYIDYAEQKQHRVRKNLLKITYGAATYDGVSISNNDGILTLNGTSNNGSFVNLATAIKLPIGNYILTGGSENLMIRFQKTFSGYGFDDTGAGRNIVCSEEVTSGVCSLKLTANYTYNNVKVYPMIRKADITDDTYEPYIENTEVDVTLPALPTLTGTNVLSVGTEAQPSDIYLKGKIKKKPKIYYKIYYYSQDGQTLLYTESVLKGSNGMYSGIPTKMADPQYTYTFAGWSSSTGQTTATTDVLKNIAADKSVYAAFEAVEKTYDVKFYNADVLLYTDENVEYGGTAAYSGNTPTKEETAQYTYTFIGWNTNSSASTADADALTNVTADRTVYAIFTAVSKGYTVYFYNGETLLETVTGVPSGGTATYTGTTPTKSGYIFDGWNPSNTNITADTSCYAQFEEDDMYESITDTWSEIIANVSNGTYSTKYHIGDTKKIDLGTEGEVIMTIVGIDTDDLADNSGKAPITWISKQLLKTDHRMNPAKQSGTSGTGTLGGWEACEMRSYLINTIKPLLPSEVRNALKTVKKYSRIYNTSGTAVNNVVSNDDIWIPSMREMNFTGYETSGVTYSTAFPDNASRIKHKVGGAAAWWWLRSASIATIFGIVYGGGSNSGNRANDSYGVAVGFVI